MVKSNDLADHSNPRAFWTINRVFSVRFSDHHLNARPFDNQMVTVEVSDFVIWYPTLFAREKRARTKPSVFAEV